MNDDNSHNLKNIKPPKVVKKLSERYLRNSGQYYLGRFPASSNHFVIVMSRKIDKSCREHIDQDRQIWVTHVQEILVPYFQDIGFLNDELYASALFNSLKNKGFSKQKIKSRMYQKSVDAHYIDQFLNDAFDDKIAILQFAKKKKIGKFRQTKYENPKDKNKDLGKLARAGFSYNIAMSVFE